MTRLVMTCMTALLVLAGLHDRKFNRLQTVETYEIRPGILMMPVYSDTGEVCRVALEKRHVFPKGVDLDAEMSLEEIYGIFDEIAPKDERGQPKLNLPVGGDLTMVDGPSVTTVAAYENVLIRMYGKNKKADTRGYVAATIEWEKHKCKR